jgi:hypothetical protein
MKSKMLGLLVAGLLAVPMAANAAPIELIVNGGFETGDLIGWTCTGADLCVADPIAPHSGTYSIQAYDNVGFATLSQTIGTTAGVTYDFSFYSFAFIPSALGNILRYQIGAGPIVSVATTGAYALTAASFVAVAGSTSINFYFETDPGTGTWQIDDVSVLAPEAIPEPASLTLLGIGLASVVARRFRRTRA